MPTAPARKPNTPTPSAYQPRTFSNLDGVVGLSSEQIGEHLSLYQGYVKAVNGLDDEIRTIESQGNAGHPMWSELLRRRGFEYNGMRLHELYFEALGAPGAKPATGSNLEMRVQANFGSVAAWEEQFRHLGEIRGIGWAMLVEDPKAGRLQNIFVNLHQDGQIVDFHPIVVMDLWEHAYLIDYRSAEKKKYVDAFMTALNWEVCSQRLGGPAQ